MQPSQPQSEASQTLQSQRHRTCLPLTAVSFVCSARLGPDTLAHTISDFVPHKRWTVQSACECGFLRLLKRVIAQQPANQHPKYRSHVFSQALVHAVKHNNAIELLECLHAYCPTGDATTGMAEAARLGNVHLMDWLLEHHQNIEMDPKYVENAAREGHLNVLQWLKERAPHPERHFANSVQHAAFGGHLKVARWLHANTNGETHDSSVKCPLLNAMKAGNLDMLKCLHEDLGYRFEAHAFHIDLVAPTGNLEMLKWLYEHDYRVFSGSALIDAAGLGYVDTVEWLVETDLIDRDYCSCDDAFKKAAECGHLDIVRLLRGLIADPFKKCLESALKDAATNGHFEIVQWLYREATAIDHTQSQTPSLCERAMVGAASNGHLETMQFLYQEATASGCLHHPVSWCKKALIGAASNEHFQVFQWLLTSVREDRQLPEEEEDRDYRYVTTEAVSNAAGNGHVEFVQWLHERRVPNPWYDITPAAKSGRLELVKWIAANAHMHRDVNGIATTIARKGDLEMLIWLHENVQCTWYSFTMDAAATNNHLHVVKWLHANRTEGCTTAAMDAAVSLDMVKWLHANRTEGCTTHAMDNAAEKGDFATMLFLHANRTEGCTLKAVESAYWNGHFVIVQWLRDNYPDMVQLNRFRNYLYCEPVFRWHFRDRDELKCS